MDVIAQRVSVTWTYPVIFADGVFEPGSAALRDVLGPSPRAWAIVDQGVADASPELRPAIERWAAGAGVELLAPTLVIPGGEPCKNDPELLRDLHRRMEAMGLDRHAFVLAVGGGAVLDLVGFAAATAHRGVRLVRIPTTVLSQNDGGVGVKNGVNAFGIKNFLGAFAPPWAVVCDSRFLQTLPDRDRRAGMAEALKVALVRDAEFFGWLHDHRVELSRFEPAAMRWMIRRCAELHLEHIAGSGDPFEQGSARPLDFGHWAAHKLEGMTAHALRHGEAVAIGIALDSVYSSLAGLLAPADLDAILEVLRAVGLPLWHDALLWTRGDGRLQIHAGLDEFRQHLGGALTVTLLDGIGRGREVGVIDEALVEQAISVLHAHREAP